MNTRQFKSLSRRTALSVLPLGVLGLAATAKGKLLPTSKGVLDERALSYALELLTEASTSGGSPAFIAFAHHIAILASAGDCETIRASADRFTERLYQQHNRCRETRETWLTEELGYFAECVDMDDQTLPEFERELACRRGDARNERRAA